jgi:putative addiction module CopG family antidote
MNISLTPELEAYVHGLVKSGQYGTMSEVIRAALRSHQELEAVRERPPTAPSRGSARRQPEPTTSR